MEGEIKNKSEWSSKDKMPKQWQWYMCAVFFPLSIPMTFLGSAIMKIGNLLMFDTHHLEIKLSPKSPTKEK